MRKDLSARENLYRCVVGQQGMFTTKQAEEAGYKRNNHPYHVRKGNWIREMRGIYRLPMFPQDDEDAQLVLWYLWARNRDERPQGVYSHDTALRIYDLSDLMPAKLHMTVSKKFRRFNSIPDILVLWRGSLNESDIRIMRGFAVTTPLKTLLDLAIAKHLEEALIWQAVKEAAERGLISSNDEKKIRDTFYDK